MNPILDTVVSRALLPALMLVAAALALVLTPTSARAGDVAKAREYYKECQELLDSGDACRAAKTCRRGLEEASLEPLKKLEREASAACRSKKSTRRSGRDRDDDGIPDSEDRCKREAEDFDGFQDDDGCPEDDNDEDKIADADDQCPDEAEDIDEFDDEDGCPDLDHDNDGVDDSKDKCIGEVEDADGHLDTDGCIDPDNDEDGIADVDDQCPDEGEDLDGRDDDDGCPDVDHDDDGIAEHIDQCPLDAEDFNGYLDTDGCPDGGAGPSPWGWVGLGTGVALLGTGIGLSVYGFELRDEVEAWGQGDGLAPRTQREAADQADAADAFVISGLALVGVGAAATVAGAVVLGLTWGTADAGDAGASMPTDGLDASLSGVGVAPGPDGRQRVWLKLGGRF